MNLTALPSLELAPPELLQATKALDQHTKAKSLLLTCLAQWIGTPGPIDANIFNNLQACFPMLLSVGLAEMKAGQWEWTTSRSDRQSAEGPTSTRPGDDWLATVLDQRDVQVSGEGWIGCVLPGQSAQLLVIRQPAQMQALTASDVASFAAAISLLCFLANQWSAQHNLTDRLQQLIRLTADWKHDAGMESLLQQMAETATTWIPSQRATIFLWDRPRKQLVGRPALGVEGGELRIPDNSGLVGQVIRSGQPGRVDADVEQDQQQVDRRTDKKLNFETTTLLCVPLNDDSGKCVGAFELINSRNGNYSLLDQSMLELLALHAARAISQSERLETLLRIQQVQNDQSSSAVTLKGECPQIESLRSSLQRVARTDLTVLILGENGTGKEVAAQSIHLGSDRRDDVFIAVNCAAIPENLLESELFGHEKGAFTDAQQMRQGKFELASNGTLFLDEIGDMSLNGQAKLLRVLEEKTIVRVGGSQTIPTDARVVAATNQNLAQLVQQKRFREDLYFRLNVVTLEMPPLRDRGDDILQLARFFLQQFAQRAHRETPEFSAEARKQLLQHAWPGNVRELRNMMERLAFLTSDPVIQADQLAFIASAPKSDPSQDLSLTLADATREFQFQFIQKQIDRSRGNMSDAARNMGLQRTNLYRKMKQLGMDEPE